MSKKIGKPIANKIGPKKKHESLVSRVQAKPPKDIMEFFMQLHEQRPKGIFSDIELLEERAQWALNTTGKKQEQYHSLASKHQCAKETLEHTKLLRHAIEKKDINLAVYHALRASGLAERIILHHWEYSVRLGQGVHTNQSANGAKGNEGRWKGESRAILDTLIEKLRGPKYEDWRASEKWNELIGLMDQEGLFPVERWVKGAADQSTIHYEGCKNTPLTYKTFKTRLA